MKRRFHLPLAAFAIAVVAMAVLIGWTEHTIWRQVNQLRKHYGTIESESFRFADHVEAGVRSLNDTLLRYDLHDKEEDRERLRRESSVLREWMAANRVHLTSEAERELFEEIVAQYDLYLTNVTRLLEEAAQGGAGFSERLFDRAEESSARVLDVCKRLDEAHRAAVAVFVADSHGAMVRLQWLLRLSLFLLIALGASVALLVYRGMIAPLRSQLIESRALLERQEKLSSLGVLAAGVAHEIRNPLTALKVRLHGLRKSLPNDPSLHQDVEFVGNEINRLERIVRGFLQFARPSEPELEAVPVAELFAPIRDLFASQLEKNAIRLELNPPDGVCARVDRQQLQQVLINLVQNAAESIESGGTITLRAAPRMALLGGRNLPAVALEVSDTGPGIPPDVQRRLFDPFFTTKEQGTGLGLSIAARIIHKHGGSIHCQTQLDRGTTFSIVLPRAESDES